MLILVGPSASGKTQILHVLLKKYQMKKLVTYTTRPMRVNEVEGKDYHFIDKDKFLQLIEKDFFFEYVVYNNNYYGTCKNDISSDKAVILEPQGLHKYLDDSTINIKVVVLRCSQEILRIRMLNRGDNIENVKKRLESDKKIFNSSLFACADLIIDTSLSNIYDDADQIYNFYSKIISGVENENIR